MNVLLINPPIRLNDKARHIPHGLAIIANKIRKKTDYNPKFLDINAYRYSDEKVKSILESEDFRIVLIGGLIPVYRRIIKYAEMIRDIKPGAVIIAGGSAAMSVPELLLKNSEVDIVCAGEGEKIIIDLLVGLKKFNIGDLKDIKGFYFKINGEIVHSGDPELLNNLDEESEMPAYDLLPMEIYLSNPIVGFGRDIDFIASRGCPFKCTFCYQPWGRQFRGHSVEFIIDTLKHLKDKYKIDFVSFMDDEFITKKSRVLEFCEKIKREIPGLLWACTGRADLVNENLVGQMRNAGCVSIAYGFESGSPRLLKAMKKGTSIPVMENAIRINRKFEMMLPISFILGMPEENHESCRETVDFCVRNKIRLKSLMFATPYPGTEIFRRAIDEGRIKPDKLHEFIANLEDARDFRINLTEAFTDEELLKKRDEMINEICLKVKPVSHDEQLKKLGNLFGDLINGFTEDRSLMQHRAKHGGIDIF